MNTVLNKWNIRSRFIGAKESRWGADESQHHHIYVSYDGSKEVTFDYWSSKLEPKITTERQLLEAFACVVQEAFDAYRLESIDDYVGIFGFDQKTEKFSDVLNVYDDMQTTAIKIDHIVEGDWDVVTDVIDLLNEEGYNEEGYL